MAYLSQTEFAKKIGISQPRVSKMIRDGKISQDCIVNVEENGKIYKKIDEKLAMKELGENLDAIKQKSGRRCRGRKGTKLKKLDDSENDKDDHLNVKNDKKQEVIKNSGIPNMNLAQAQTYQARFKAAILKIEYEQKIGKLIDVEIVKKESFDTARLVRDNLLSMPDKFSSILAAESNEFKVNQFLREKIIECLEILSNER